MMTYKPQKSNRKWHHHSRKWTCVWSMMIDFLFSVWQFISCCQSDESFPVVKIVTMEYLMQLSLEDQYPVDITVLRIDQEWLFLYLFCLWSTCQIYGLCEHCELAESADSDAAPSPEASVCILYPNTETMFYCICIIKTRPCHWSDGLGSSLYVKTSC